MSRGLATAANDQDFLREREDRKDYSGCPPTPALLLPLPVSLLYTPSVDNRLDSPPAEEPPGPVEGRPSFSAEARGLL